MQHNIRPYTATVTTAPTQQHQVISRDTQPSRSAASSSSSSPAVVVEDVKEDDDDDDDEYSEYYHRKQREIEELEARLKRHAEVTHQTIIGHRAATAAMKAKQESATSASSHSHRHGHDDDDDDEGDIMTMRM